MPLEEGGAWSLLNKEGLREILANFNEETSRNENGTAIIFENFWKIGEVPRHWKWTYSISIFKNCGAGENP